MVHDWEASIQNGWEGKRNDIYYQVLAGASADDPAQGLLLVIETNPNSNERSQQYFLTDEKMGTLRITQVQGTKVSLTSADGSQLFFDLSSHAFFE